jgi:hypothetical protein
MTTGGFAFCAKGMVKLLNLVEVQKSLQKKKLGKLHATSWRDRKGST